MALNISAWSIRNPLPSVVFSIILLLLGIIPSNATLLVMSIAAVLGGLVGLGSTTTTAGQLADAVKNAEARRAALIGTINLTIVGDETSQH